MDEIRQEATRRPSVKNEFFAREFVSAQYMLRVYESSQTVRRAWLFL